MTPTPTSARALLGRAEVAWSRGDVESAVALFDQCAQAAELEGDPDLRVVAVLGMARGQQYNVTPGRLPVVLHAAYEAAADPASDSRARLAAALARCWAYANEPHRAGPFAAEAMRLAESGGDDVLLADALDAALASRWGPDHLAARREWAVRLGDVSAHLVDPEARLQAALWELTVAWEVLDVPRMHRSMRAIELLSEESARARFFAASRRLPLELLRGRLEVAPTLIAQAEAAAEEAAIPDGYGVVQSMRGYSAYFSGDTAQCADSAALFDEYALDNGVTAVRAEAAVIWLGARRLDKVAETVGAFTPEVLRELPRDNDWLLILQCVAEGAIAVGDREVTSGVVELLGPYAGRSVVNAGAVMWHGVTDDTLGRGCALLGRTEEAQRHGAAAHATYDRIGARWWRDRLGAAADLHAEGARSVHLHETSGGLWLVGTEGPGGSAAMLPRMRGLEHLHLLLVHPDTEVSALSLVSPAAQPVDQRGLEVLDDAAVRAYRQRIALIDAELGGRPLDDRPDLAAEREALAAQLSGAVGLAGRPRRTGGDAERARVAVRKAVIGALARIAEHDPWLARHLHDHVHTGHQCRYASDPDVPVHWILQ